jgi:hypothetical protein
MSEIRLTCLSPENAEAVVAEHVDYFGAGRHNTVRQDGAQVVIDFQPGRGCCARALDGLR